MMPKNVSVLRRAMVNGDETAASQLAEKIRAECLLRIRKMVWTGHRSRGEETCE